MRKLGRYSAHRQALLRNLAISLIQHKIILTTIAKAKELRPFIEKLITKARVYSLHSYRQLLGVLYNDELTTKELFNIGQMDSIKNRPGGYTRIVKNNLNRDGSPRAYIQILIDNIKDDHNNTTQITDEIQN